MMPSPALLESAANLRAAVAEGSFVEAQLLLLDYRKELDKAIGALPPQDLSQSLELIAEARDLLEWARRMSHTARACSADLLKQLPATPPYGRGGRRPRPTFELRG